MAATKTKKKKVTPAGKKLARRVYKKMVSTYYNKKGIAFSVGDRVQLKKTAMTTFKTTEGETFLGNPLNRATVFSLLPDLQGCVVLEHKLGGFWTWDVEDLEKL